MLIFKEHELFISIADADVFMLSLLSLRFQQLAAEEPSQGLRLTFDKKGLRQCTELEEIGLGSLLSAMQTLHIRNQVSKHHIQYKHDGIIYESYQYDHKLSQKPKIAVYKMTKFYIGRFQMQSV